MVGLDPGKSSIQAATWNGRTVVSSRPWRAAPVKKLPARPGVSSPSVPGAMSRISDTRFRTREAAARLATAGRQAHAVTVDLIYAEILQGSRTTINDELKLWKDEQAKVDALRAALPKPVADAMLATWATAIEHGEKVFGKRSEEIEQELAQANSRTDQLERTLADLQKENVTLTGQLDDARNELRSSRQETSSERCAKETAQAQLDVLGKEVDAARERAEKIVLEIKLECQSRVETLRGKVSAEEGKRNFETK